MNYFLDLVIAALVIGCAAAGSRKGALKMLLVLAGYIAAVAAATFVSNVASDYVYESLVKPSVISALESKAESLEDEYLSSGKINDILEENGFIFDNEQLALLKDNSEQYNELLNNVQIREELNELFMDYCKALTSAFSGVVPEEIIDEAERYLEENNIDNNGILTLITQEKESMIEIVEKEIIKPLMIKTIKFVLFAATFAIVMLIASIVSYAAKIVRKIPVVNSADSFLGTMLGIIQGILYIAAVNVCVSMFIKFTSDANEYLNTTIISETYIFGLLYDATFYIVALILN